ncbi:origin recognition complex subunit 5-like [Diabrotica virgifera virgifera]|uniref:Origin recognition complex subunit 5 n=1 Tax=Diabrotica virgifera virgifera TaxID=50390 RepID=A0ABM5JVX1_DIAVI|nr:origin recognition complex subunit 5-like [Diabrotica virgifera virgifera]
MAHNLSNLRQFLPCRDIQIELLYNLFAYKDEPQIESVYVYGGPSSGKSIVVTSTLEHLGINHAIVNIIECYSSKILFETILNKISGHQLDPKNPVPYARCDNMMDFLYNVEKCNEEKNLNGFVLVLDNADELRNMEHNLLPCFLRLKQLTGISLVVVMISEILFEKYYTKSGGIEPLKIHFPQYNKKDLLEIISLDFEDSKTFISQHFDQILDFDVNFYKNYLNLFLSTFYRACKDLSELRYMSRINFVKYCEPVFKKELALEDSMGLWRNIAPVLKQSLEMLYLRIDTTKPATSAKEKSMPTLELPFYAKYLLIAAYLASYNPPKDDKRLFMKYHGKQRKKLKDIRLKNKVSEQLNTQLGPKPFVFDRLLAIFYSILDEKDNKMGFNNNLLVQISSLMELRLLSSVSDSCVLDGQKYKCNVSFEFIKTVCRSVGFDVKKYLSDFSHI